MSKLEAFRKLIREEMRLVIKEELSKLLVENKVSSNYKDTFKPKKQEEPPLTLNTGKERKVVAPRIAGNSMLNSLLSETAMTMQPSDEVHISTTDMDGYALMQYGNEEVAQVGEVNDMLQSAKGSGVHEMVQINQVPDFSQLMDKMIQKGVM
jgi:hypothetical protein